MRTSEGGVPGGGGRKASTTAVARLRLAAQGLLPAGSDANGLGQADDPLAAVRRMGALQSQDLASGLLAVGVRTRAGTASGVAAALASGAVVRTWTMRGTLFLVAAEDVRTFVGLAADRVMRSAATRHRGLGIAEEDVAVVRKVAEDRLAGDRGLTRAELFEAFDAAGQPTAGQRGIHLLSILSHQMVLVQGPLRGRQQEFRLADEWLPRGEGLAGDDAVEHLARRYLASHGPACERDFAWWLGQPLGVVRGPFRAAAADGASLEFEGRELFCAPEVAALLGTRRGARAVLALPGFDELILGYQDRSVAVPDAYLERVIPGINGVFKATVSVGGRTVGTWVKGGTPSAPRAVPELFEELAPAAAAGVERAVARIEAYWAG
ncbi:winged helix DNA-binding domain-containing protein [Sinomonas sp. JGH33]|uniref:Winged helix DNA-binding domain-containing protein n=1 Tax=Sinomonas terricola TaxID=3110330 RepID=A0ABU5T1L6_9MICC|nr:winged helix DNA-binding domain-containing protein [Sinomonas sp. JGH33]MEA5453540.1 winged helix DNA-binding domain-containing protein [Sinomonas sp. JGH33]